MLYLLGMGLGSDIFARLIHYSTLILFLLATYAFGRRFLPKPGGWIAAAILLGIPILPLWGNAAYTDIAWALFQFLAIAIFLVWIKERNPWLLGLSGIMQGLALGSKYLAISGAGILLIFVLWYSLRDEGKWTGWNKAIRNGMIFGLGAFIVALPWYLKNFIWTGNPVFPLYFPQHVIDPTQLKIWMDYIYSFGTGKNWYDYLLLPFNLYLQHDKFGTFMGSMEMPSPLFLFSLAYPWIRRTIDPATRKTLDVLGLFILVQFIFWALGSQQTRFLLPIYPGLAISASIVLVQLYNSPKLKMLSRALAISSISSMVIATAIYMGLYINLVQPQKVLFGLETKADFLQRNIRDFSGINYINQQLSDSDYVMLLWDGRGYYCNRRCLPDIDQSHWISLVNGSKESTLLTHALQEQNITHLLISNEDVSFFILKHDNAGIHKEALQYLINEFLPECGLITHEDDWSTIYQITYDKEECN